MYRQIRPVQAYDENGFAKERLPVGLLVEVISRTTTDVIIVDLCTNVAFHIPVTEFQLKFKPI